MYLLTCVSDVYDDTIVEAGEVPDDVEIGEIPVARLSVTPVGADVQASRVVIPFIAQGLEIDLVADLGDVSGSCESRSIPVGSVLRITVRPDPNRNARRGHRTGRCLPGIEVSELSGCGSRSKGGDRNAGPCGVRRDDVRTPTGGLR